MSSCSTESKQDEPGSRTRASNHNSTANSRQIPFRFCAPIPLSALHFCRMTSGHTRPASTQTCRNPTGCNSLISVTQEMQFSKPEMPQLQHSCTHPASSLKQSTFCTVAQLFHNPKKPGQENKVTICTARISCCPALPNHPSAPSAVQHIPALPRANSQGRGLLLNKASIQHTSHAACSLLPLYC